MAIEYITTRELLNQLGQPTGRIRILKMKEAGEAVVEYVCPTCGFSEKRKELWTEPFLTGKGANKTFNIVCKKCNRKIKILKLKKEIKKAK